MSAPRPPLPPALLHALVAACADMADDLDRHALALMTTLATDTLPMGLVELRARIAQLDRALTLTVLESERALHTHTGE